MEYRPPEELPDEYQLFVPIDYKAYKPVTDPLFLDLFPSAEFPNEDFAEVGTVDLNL